MSSKSIAPESSAPPPQPYHPTLQPPPKKKKNKNIHIYIYTQIGKGSCKNIKVNLTKKLSHISL